MNPYDMDTLSYEILIDIHESSMQIYNLSTLSKSFNI